MQKVWKLTNMKDAKINDNFFSNPINVATVIDNNDPESNYRIKVKIDIVHDSVPNERLPWAARASSSFMGFGDADIIHSVPEVGTKVLILFVGNDPNSIIYFGSLYKKNSVTPSGDDYLGTYGIYTKKGEFIGIDKINTTFKMIYEGKIDISKITEMKINVDGPVTITGTKFNIKGGEVTIEKGTQIGFNCLGQCLFTGARHVSNTSM